MAECSEILNLATSPELNPKKLVIKTEEKILIHDFETEKTEELIKIQSKNTVNTSLIHLNVLLIPVYTTCKRRLIVNKRDIRSFPFMSKYIHAAVA